MQGRSGPKANYILMGETRVSNRPTTETPSRQGVSALPGGDSSDAEKPADYGAPACPCV
jgi:hypothetical protein